ncbi:MAG: TolC family protein [Prevotella sp.]|nr:TolC family protein [Prevotella sp.]
MKKVLTIGMLAASLLSAEAQQLLTLDSCRAMALRNNKQMGISKLKQDIATNTRKALRTKYLPKLSAVGGYEFVSKEISLLSNDQKSALNNLGTSVVGNITQQAPSYITNWVQQGIISMEQAQQLSQLMNQYGAAYGQQAATALNGIGQDVTDAFRTDNRNMFAVAVMVRQPIYMGGAITAANKIADITEDMMANSAESTLQNTLYSIDQAYWQVVSVRQKERLANSFLEVVKQLDSDVEKMIREGVATYADGLKVKVKVNEAEMNVTQAQNGLVLSKMLLCQLCGLPIDSQITLADEDKEDITIATTAADVDVQTAIDNRPELKMLQNTVDIARQTTKVVRAAYLPHIALTGGYLATNPNIYDGYRNKFGGVWNVGVLVHVPIWHWLEGEYKIRATKAAASMANLELSEAQEKIELQVTQCKFKVREANKKLAMAAKNVEKAEENLRCANLGFHEGVLTATDVMEAQTAWVQAQSQKIDAQTDVQLTQVGLKKALGMLN